ncbi:MAG: histidine triad nucleotide-binding protein [Bacillota bacterium]
MKDCIFCRIINQDIPAELLYEDDQIVAFKDINPEAPVHILLVPRKHIPNMAALTTEDAPMIGHLHLVAGELARLMDINESGFRLVNNCKADGGQIVNHLHYHLLGGRRMQGMG